MTNRIQYTDGLPETKLDEIEWLREHLLKTHQSLTVENAQAALREFLSRSDAWLLRVEDVPSLWVESIAGA